MKDDEILWEHLTCFTCALWDLPIAERKKCTKDTTAECKCIAYSTRKAIGYCTSHKKHKKIKELIPFIPK